MKYFNVANMRTAYNAACASYMSTYTGTNASSQLVKIFGQGGENAFPAGGARDANKGYDHIIPIIQGAWEEGTGWRRKRGYLKRE